MTKLKQYTGSGIVLIVNFNGKKYYALNKRTTGPGVIAPDTHAGFFGGTDNDEERTDPLWAGCRETYEELLILNKETLKVASLVLDKDYVDGQRENFKKETERLRKAWEQKMGVELDSEIGEMIISNKKEVEFSDYDGLKMIWLVKIDLDLKKNVLLDCETSPLGEIFDRQIDLFEVDKFRKWWTDSTDRSLLADYSYKSGVKATNKGRADKDKIVSTLLMTLGYMKELKT